jgi:hypothetical protein
VEALLGEQRLTWREPFPGTILRQTMKKSYTDKQGQYLAFIY